jgi:hypothetical protein
LPHSVAKARWRLPPSGNQIPVRQFIVRGVLKTGHPQMTDDGCVDQGCVGHGVDEPITLHRIMQEMIGEGLRERYKPPQKLSHELFVLLMQLKEQEHREAAAAKRRSA